MEIEDAASESQSICRRSQKDLDKDDFNTYAASIYTYTDELNRIIALLRKRMPDLFHDVSAVSYPNLSPTGETVSAAYGKVLLRQSMTKINLVSEMLQARLDRIRVQRGKETEGKQATAVRQDERPQEASTPIFDLTNVWRDIGTEYGESKLSFGKKINFIKDQFKRRVIFRDIEQAYVLARCGFCKPSVVLAGGVIEELLRLYLEQRGITPAREDLNSYIKACVEYHLLKGAIEDTADSVRQFRNIVHLKEESSRRHTITKATAKSAVASIFTIVNDFQISA